MLGADADERRTRTRRPWQATPSLPDGEDSGDRNGRYVLRVRVSDPSTASATVNVIVTVTDVNEPPEFDEDVPTVLSVTEHDTGKNLRAGTPPVDLQGNTYAVTDEDSEDGPPQAGAYSLEGADKDSFSISNTKVLCPLPMPTSRTSRSRGHTRLPSWPAPARTHGGCRPRWT